MTTVRQVLDWPVPALAELSAALDVDADALVSAASSAAEAADTDPAWRGSTHDAARLRVAAVRASLLRTAAATEGAARRATRAHTALSGIQAALRALVLTAAITRFQVADDGRVTHPDPARRGDALYLSQRITALLALAVDADADEARLIADAADRLDGRGGPKVVAPDGSPVSPLHAARALERTPITDRRAYWESLSQRERDMVIATAPSVIGNMAGLPFADRIDANRVAIRNALDREIAVGRGTGDRAGLYRRMLAEASDVPGGPPRRRRFLAFDPAGTGRFVEVLGAIDTTTRNVAVFVPGTGTALDRADEARRRSAALHARTGAPVLVFGDGDFPQIIAGPPWRAEANQAISARAVLDIAPRLLQFTRDLDVELTTSAPAAQTTVIGHSYGGSIVGTAEQLGMRADRVVHASSAGTGVLDAEWRNPDPDVERYSLTPPGDPIHYAQRLGAGVHGGDPDIADGVTRVDTGYTGPDEHGRREVLGGWESHSAYLDDPESDAFRALADIVVGERPPPYVDRGSDTPQLDVAAALLNESPFRFTPFGPILDLGLDLVERLMR